MSGFESGNNIPDDTVDCMSSLKNNITLAINDSKLTTDEASQITDQLDSSVDLCMTETFKELQGEAKEILKNGINMRKGGGSERGIGNYLGIDLPSIVNFLDHDGYTIPDNYSIKDNGYYLVFYDEDGNDIATRDWKTGKLAGGGMFIANDDPSDNSSDFFLEGYLDLAKGDKNKKNKEKIQKIKEELFDANIIFEDPLDNNSALLASESFGLGQGEFRSMILDFQQQVVLSGNSPHSEDLWRNIGLFERGGSELWFNQQTPQGQQYIGVYSRNGSFLRGGMV